MSRARLLDLTHVPGRHCASTGLADLMRYWGIGLSEPMCFGLGSGLNFSYIKDEGISPSRVLHTRGPFLERDFFAHTGLPARNVRQPDPRKAWVEVRDEIDAGRPVLLRNDLYYLDYYKARNHFGGHIVVLVGYDEDERTAFLADTERPGFQTTGLESLARARSSTAPPFVIDNEYFALTPEGDSLPVPLDVAVRRAIKTECNYMLRPDLEFMGLRAMHEMAADLPGWADAADWAWCAKYGFQLIEVRGTGGSAFRNLYAEFLEESSALAPEINSFDSVALALRDAKLWAELAAIFKRAADDNDPSLLRGASRILSAIADLENELFSRLESAVAPGIGEAGAP